MTTFRGVIPEFQLANPIYIAAEVTFYTVDEDGEATSTLATLYAEPTGNQTVANPQTLDSEGKFEAPVYVSVQVIAEIVGPNVASHRTGAIFSRGIWRGNWVTATVYHTTDFVVDPASLDLYGVADDYTSGASIAADVSAGHLILLIDQTSLQVSNIMLEAVLDGGGTGLSNNAKVVYVEVPVDCVIERWTILADRVGSIVLDVWKTTYALAPPTIANTIVGSAPPALTAAQKAQSSTLTGWVTSFARGDILAFAVTSGISDCQRVTISLNCARA